MRPDGAQQTCRDDQPDLSPRFQRWIMWLGVVLAIGLFAVLALVPGRQGETKLTYSSFVAKVQAHQVRSVTIESTGSVSGRFIGGHSFSTTIPVALSGPPLMRQLAEANVTVTATPASSGSGGSQLLGWLFLLLPVLALVWLWRRLAGGRGLAGGALGMGKSKAKVFDAEHPTTSFADVAGYDGVKAEVSEVVDFLREPERYRRAGAVAPRGVLMVGPPGTGKTLMARAVAGEAKVPFLSVTASSFVEMFVGVGAARVRDLFEEARKRSPSIIFLDEIDAIGQRRSSAGGAVSNDEREQTLNQLLAEMDGFDAAEGVVVLAATNRPEVLDVALLRPGRFDRQVVIPLPNHAERRAVLAVHCKGKQLAPDVDLDVIARATPGFSGADLANLANEAAIAAVRDNRVVITRADFSEARDRIMLGRREGSNVLLADEKLSVSVHESGHAIVAALLPNADPVEKVTILPSGRTLGVTEQLPLAERHLYTEAYLKDALVVRLGGRAAELVEFRQGSTGAANDLEQATELATRMVREFGLSAELGPIGYPSGGSVFLGNSGPGLSSRPYAEQTQAIIDHEVTRLLKEAEQRAVQLLRDHREQLRALSDLLLEQETVDGSVVHDLVMRQEVADRST